MSDLAQQKPLTVSSAVSGTNDAQLQLTSQASSASAASQLSVGANARSPQPQSTVSASPAGPPVEHKGWLYKWTNYIKGYQKRWFILENGYLSYYRNQAEVAHTCRGTINLMSATIQSDDPLTIVLQNGPTNVFHLKAANDVERQVWLSKLELVRSQASQIRSSVGVGQTDTARGFGSPRGRFVDEDDDDDDDAFDVKEREEGVGQELEKQLATLSSKMDDLHTCFSLICKQHSELTRLLNAPVSGDQSVRDKDLNEKLKLYKISSQAMLNASQEYYDTATQQGRRWQRLLEREHEQRVQFEGVVEQLARQQRQLQRQAIRELKSARAISPAPRDQQPDAASGLLHHSQASQGRVMPTAVPTNAAKTDSAARPTSHNGNGEAAASGSLLAIAHLKPHDGPADSVSVSQGRSSLMTAESDEEDVNGDFYDALDIEAAAAVAPSYFKLSNAGPTSVNVKSATSLDNLSSASSETSVADVPPLSSSANKTSGAHARSQSDWTSAKQGQTEAPSSDASLSAQRSQSKQSILATTTSSSNSTPTSNTSAPSQQLVPATGAPVVWPDGQFCISPPRRRPRRTAIPFKPASSINLWSIIKNCVGRELSKIPFPVNFSEPISMLQRLVEDLEYSNLLDRAAECADPIEQMALVAVFNVSSYSSTGDRPAKPFNPVLGETYELDRTDESEFGWRMIAEQVSHHPPAAAFHCESAKWVCFEEFTLGSKFRGMYLQVQPLGVAHCEFKRDRNHYTWSRVTTMVHNIIVGKLWIDNIGECVVVNHTLGVRCVLKFVQYTYFRSDVRRVLGVIKDNKDEARYVLYGTWDEKMEGAKLKRPPGSRNPYANLDPDGVTKIWQSLDASEKKLLWRRNGYPPNSDKMYNFTAFAIHLNEPEPGVAPSDSRLRPDQRLMEQGLWDAANAEKLRVEEKQRAARRALEKKNEQRAHNGLPPIEWEPVWFKRKPDPYTEQEIFTYNGEYWDCKRRGDWSKAQDIF